MATNMREKRVAKERQKIEKFGLPPGIELVDGESLKDWTFDIRVLDSNPIYANQIYRLKFQFPQSYPIEPPEVTFDIKPDRPVPMHPHIYSNGIICLDLLDNQGWSPVQSAESVCMSIQSMLTSNSKNERPPGNEEFVKGNRLRPRDIEFLYHDNTLTMRDEARFDRKLRKIFPKFADEADNAMTTWHHEKITCKVALARLSAGEKVHDG